MTRTFEALCVSRRIAVAASLTLAICWLFVAGSATAGALDDYKSSGEIGEQTDGYVAAVASNPSSDVRETVRDVNDRRREKYTGIAEENGTDPATVGQLAGEKLVRRVPPGTYIRQPGGKWKQR